MTALCCNSSYVLPENFQTTDLPLSSRFYFAKILQFDLGTGLAFVQLAPLVRGCEISPCYLRKTCCSSYGPFVRIHLVPVESSGFGAFQKKRHFQFLFFALFRSRTIDSFQRTPRPAHAHLGDSQQKYRNFSSFACRPRCRMYPSA